jgi:ABC-type methionine transport system ATPase subunit
LDITILQGSIGRIKDEPYAQLTVSVPDDDEERLRRFFDSLARREVHCERLP